VPNTPRSFTGSPIALLADEIIDKDQDYYSVDVVFLVEGTLFRVPRAPFEETSTVFSDIFRLPVPEGGAPDGFSDDQPFRLDGVKKKDFRLLLQVLVPRFLHTASESWKEWFSILELALMWEMDQVKDLAIQWITSCSLNPIEWMDLLRLSTSRQGFSKIREKAIEKLTFSYSLPPIERILLARECRVVDWLLMGYKELVDRNTIITVEEQQQLGIHTTVKLFRILLLQHPHYYDRSELDEILRADFQAELQETGYSEP
jgi:hypothetical protein